MEQQPKQALSWFIETLGLGERRPMVTIESGDALALVKAGTGSAKNGSVGDGSSRAIRDGARFDRQRRRRGGWMGSRCDILLLSLYDLPDRSIVSSRAMSCE